MIFISAGMAFMPHAFQVHVGAAKAGIDMLMKNLAIEWGRYGIRCNTIVPGPIEGTEGMKRLSDPAMHDQFIGSVPLRRMGTVDDIGQAAVLSRLAAGRVHHRLRGRLRRRPEPGRIGALQYRSRESAASPKRRQLAGLTRNVRLREHNGRSIAAILAD